MLLSPYTKVSEVFTPKEVCFQSLFCGQDLLPIQIPLTVGFCENCI